jgi:glycosyltransferase involved in cell wall biosynthesis
MDFLYGEKWKKDPYSKVVYNGIDMSVFSLQLDLDKKKQELGLNKKYNLCTVGRMAYQKNPLFIVDIMNAVFKLRDDCEFVWVGTGDMGELVKNRISEYRIEDKMHLLGVRTDVAEILRCCDLFLLPSLFEGLAIVLIEAQGAGLPCAVSDTTSLESDCGGCEYIPLKESPEYWAQKISDILDGKNNPEVKREELDQYSIGHMVKEMEGVFGNEQEKESGFCEPTF